MTAPLVLGEIVYPTAPDWAIEGGTFIREKYGVEEAWISDHPPLKVRRASQFYRCQACSARIRLGELHGSAFYLHYCTDCITRDRPAAQMRPLQEVP